MTKETELINIANPIKLGVHIAIGMFIAFPVLLLCLFFVLLIFGVSII